MPQLLPLIERDHTAWLRMNLEGERRPISLTAAKPGTLRQYCQAAWTVTALIPPRSPRTPSPPGLRLLCASEGPHSNLPRFEVALSSRCMMRRAIRWICGFVSCRSPTLRTHNPLTSTNRATSFRSRLFKMSQIQDKPHPQALRQSEIIYTNSTP